MMNVLAPVSILVLSAPLAGQEATTDERSLQQRQTGDRPEEAAPDGKPPVEVAENLSATTHGMRETGFYGEWPFGCDGITGDWGGLRNKLMDEGLNFNASYTSILQSNFHGGLDTGFFGAGPFGLTLTADLDKLAGFEGSTFFIDWEYYHWYNSRVQPSDLYDKSGSWVGDNGNFIDPGASRLNQIAQLYWAQDLFDGSLHAQFGKIDVNEQFSAIDAAGSFMYSAASYSPTLNLYFPTYPNSATALQLVWDASETVTGKFGWFDGTTAAFPDGPATGSRGPSTFFDNARHWFFITQWDFRWQLDDLRPGSIGVAPWLQTGDTSTAGNSTTGVHNVPGFYVQWQQTLWAPDAEIAEEAGGIATFGQFGWSDPQKNPVHWSIMAGVSATGVIPGRPGDSLGLQATYSRFTDDVALFESMRADGSVGPSGGYESCLELYYLAQLTPCLYVQPGIEWIGNPGGGDGAPLDNAVVGYLAIGIEF